MKRLFLDTNFIIDYLVREDYKQQSQEFLSLAAIQGYEFYVSFLSVANFAYIARKLPQEFLLQKIKSIIEIFEVVPNNKKQIKDALEVNTPDFEDILQYQAAIDSKSDFIITRNEKDFSFSKIPVISPTNFIEKFLLN